MDVKQIKLGQVNNIDAHVTRIVHISDTHMAHNALVDVIPHGDILIHSGDFGSYQLKRHFKGHGDFVKEISDINEFFGALPHRHKIFVAGNHETNFPSQNAAEVQSRLTNGIYLQDSSVVINGIKIFGSPWNNSRWYSYASSFARTYDELRLRWAAIPRDTHVLVTHIPPRGILDLADVSAWKKLWKSEGHCHLCDVTHQGGRFLSEHWGCPHLRETVFSVKPLAHLFGHVHGCNGIETVDDITFSNAALKCHPTANVIDLYMDPENTETQTNPEYAYSDSGSSTTCTVM